jgi:hypothetical protein
MGLGRGGAFLPKSTAAPPPIRAVLVGPPAPPPALPPAISSLLNPGPEAGSTGSVSAAAAGRDGRRHDTAGASRLAPLGLSNTSRAVADGTASDSHGGPPVFLNDTERMLLVSCMDIDPYAPCRTLAPTAASTWLAPRGRDRGGSPQGVVGKGLPPALGSRGSGRGSEKSVGAGSESSRPSTPGTGRVVSMGRLAASKSAVFVSLMGIHMLVRHLLGVLDGGDCSLTASQAMCCFLVSILRPPRTVGRLSTG